MVQPQKGAYTAAPQDEEDLYDFIWSDFQGLLRLRSKVQSLGSIFWVEDMTGTWDVWKGHRRHLERLLLAMCGTIQVPKWMTGTDKKLNKEDSMTSYRNQFFLKECQ